MSLGYQETLVSSASDGATLTAAAAASCIPAQAKYTLSANFFKFTGQLFKVTAQGRISNVLTTPGTARFDVRFASTVVYDTGAINLNTTAKTNVPWWLEILLTCRALGSTANLMGAGSWTSESLVGSPANTAGGNGTLIVPVTAPVVGNNFDSSVSQLVDLFFTQTVATGSLTCHQYKLESLN